MEMSVIAEMVLGGQKQLQPVIAILTPAVGLVLLRQWALLLQWTLATCLVATCLQPATAEHACRQILGAARRLAKGLPGVLGRLIKGWLIFILTAVL
jgi:hypothetical protein